MVLSSPSTLQAELAILIVSVLHLEVEPGEIIPHEPLFGEGAGLNLDSIDALELALEIGEKYGIEFQPDDEDNVTIFASLESLCEHVATNRKN